MPFPVSDSNFADGTGFAIVVSALSSCTWLVFEASWVSVVRLRVEYQARNTKGLSFMGRCGCGGGTANITSLKYNEPSPRLYGETSQFKAGFSELLNIYKQRGEKGCHVGRCGQ